MSELIGRLDIFNFDHMGAYFLSAGLFSLYAIINLIDTNSYILNFKVLDVEGNTRGSLVYSYMAGYFMFILKSIIALVTLFVLTLIIRVLVATMITIVTDGYSTSQAGGAQEIMSGASFKASSQIVEAFLQNARGVLGFFLSPIFLVIFLIIIPLLLYLFLMAYVRFYNPEIVKEENLNEAPRILLTYHHHLMFIISSLILVAFIFSLYIWFDRANARKV